MVAHANRTLSLSGMTFTGKRKISLDLTAGNWTFAPALKVPGTFSIVVK